MSDQRTLDTLSTIFQFSSLCFGFIDCQLVSYRDGHLELRGGSEASINLPTCLGPEVPERVRCVLAAYKYPEKYSLSASNQSRRLDYAP